MGEWVFICICMFYNGIRGWEPLFPVGDSDMFLDSKRVVSELILRDAKQNVVEGSLPPFIKIKPELTWLGFFFA